LKKSAKAALCGLSTALSLVFMFFGGAVSIFAYVVPMILGVLMSMIAKTLGNGSAVSVFISTSVLSFILAADKECVLMYVLFFGYYPIIKPYIERIKSKLISYILKFAVFNLSVFITEILCVYIFRIPFFEDGGFSNLLVIAFAAAMNVIFILYDFMLNRFLILYRNRLENRISKMFKL